MKKVFIYFALVAMMLSGCGSSAPAEEVTVVDDAVAEEEVAEERVEVVVYEDDVFKATYIGPVDMSDYLEGMAAVGFLLENKTDVEITVYPMDTSVDDFMVSFLSGTPARMNPGKKFNQVWMFADEDVSFDSFEVSFNAVDADFNELVKTEVFEVSAK